MDILIVSDIGGTQMRVAAFDADTLSQVAHKRIPTQGNNQLPTDRLIQLISEVGKDHTIKAVGIAAPGFLDPKKGVVYEAPNIPGWNNLELKKIIEDSINAPVFIGNDANMAALGEWKYGAGKGHKDILYLTISTGIGSGVIIDGELLLGHRGLAAEFGHVTIDPNGPMCGCGHPGHLEALSSGTAIRKYVMQKLSEGVPSLLTDTENLSSKDIYLAAMKNDTLAVEAFSRAGKYLGIAIANFLHMLNPSIVILGGGVTQAGDLLLEPLKESLNASVISPQYLENFEISLAKLGDDVGLWGVLVLLLSEYSHKTPDPYS
jgi:glucokinase